MQRFPFVDVLRGLAALLVVWYHVIELGAWATFPDTGIAALPRIGWIGVDLFFVISGFVIGKAAVQGYLTGGDWRIYFVKRRLRRIVPLYFLTMVCYLFMVSPEILMYGWISVGHVVSHLLFLHNLMPSTYGSINGPSWSVALEMQFYLLIVLLSPWLACSKWWTVLIAGVSVAIAWRFATTLVWVPNFTNSNIHSDVNVQRVAATQLPGTLDQFAMGICLAKLAMAGKLSFQPVRFFAWASTAVIFLTIAWFIFWPRAHYWYYPEMIRYWRTLLSAGFAALLACTVMIPWSAGWLSRPFLYLGEISYGLYLWHLPILLTLLEKTPWRGQKLLTATILFTVVMAALSWHFFEQLWLKPRQHLSINKMT